MTHDYYFIINTQLTQMVGAYLMLFELISQTVNLPFTILFAQFFDKFYQPKVQLLSRHIGYISFQALHFRLVSCKRRKTRSLDFCFSYHPAIPEKISLTILSLQHVDFGIAFSFKFLSSSALSGFQKALEQDAMSSSVSRRKVQSKREI